VRPREHPLELEAEHLPFDHLGGLRGFGAGPLVARLLGELVERLRVVEGAADLVERDGDRLEAGLLLQQRLRLRVVGPEAGVLGEPADLRRAVPLPVDVKETPAAPRGGG
jgi:hypothetical protein